MRYAYETQFGLKKVSVNLTQTLMCTRSYNVRRTAIGRSSTT